jgi:hypothetical protein
MVHDSHWNIKIWCSYNALKNNALICFDVSNKRGCVTKLHPVNGTFTHAI